MTPSIACKVSRTPIWLSHAGEAFRPGISLASCTQSITLWLCSLLERCAPLEYLQTRQNDYSLTYFREHVTFTEFYGLQ